MQYVLHIGRITVHLWQCCLSLSEGTNIVSPSEAASPAANPTDQLMPQPSSPLPGTHAPTSQNPLNSTTTSPARTDDTAPVEIAPTATPLTSTFADSITQSKEPAQPKTHLFTSVPTPEPPKLETTTTTTMAQHNSTPSTSPSQETPKISVSPRLTSPLNTLQPSGHPDTSSVAHQPSTILPGSSPTAQAKAHVNTPSQLNVGGDSKCIISSMLVYGNLFWAIRCLDIDRAKNKLV